MPDSPAMFTPYADVNAILAELLAGVRGVLGEHFIGMYLEGSLSSGDFDVDSDIDYVVATDNDIEGELFLALQAMHERIAKIDSWWATQLEGVYISLAGLRRFDPQHALHPTIERDFGQRLKMVQYDESWAVHRHVLRKRGITLAGPDPRTLIDPVTPDELRRAMQPLLQGWLVEVPQKPEMIAKRGWQSFTVLSLCRILYTLEFGDVVSKPAAARWAQNSAWCRWNNLIDRAWDGRHHPEDPAAAEDIEGTLEFIRYVVRSLSAVPPART